ncbi:MAG: hypothetical protein IJV32_07985 [Bacteroidales bacterium]|nr:hypothetical protein [Bacteroidales bacterium]MBQ9654141.1 hypothetical protein [Bacteroidales bacterium]
MVRFFGKASGKVDDKGRLVLPAIFRDAMVRGGSEGMTLVLKKNIQQPCLDLFPSEEWDRRSGLILDKIDTELSTEDALFWTKYNDGVFTIVPDTKLGRLNIPSELLESAGITKEVVFGGVGYKLQIWDADTYKANLLSDQEFKDAASKLSARK